MNGPTIVDRRAFDAKHKAKFDAERLSDKQRAQRYRDYVASERATHAKSRSGRDGRGTTHPTSSVQVAGVRARGLTNAAVMLRQNELLRAMFDPFNMKSVPRIPDGEFNTTSTTMFKFNVNIQSNATGGCAFFMRPTPWQAFAVSNTNSDCTGNASAQSAYVSSFEFNAVAAGPGRASAGMGDMPLWTTNAWSIALPGARDVDNGANLEFAPQDCSNAEAFFGVASAWRPVCAGFRFEYTAAVLSAAGQIAVARWPGAYAVPTLSNLLLRMDGDQSTYGAAQGEFGPSFRTVQALPGAEVYAARDGCTAVWAPNGSAAQRAWRPVKPQPLVTHQTGGDYGIEQYSDTPQTNIVRAAPPICGDPVRGMAVIDRILSTNANAIEVALVSGQPVIAANTLTYFQDTIVSSAADQNRVTSYRMRDLVDTVYSTDMMVADTGLILIGQGLPPNTTIGTIEVVIGVEYIHDTRTIVFGGGGAGVARQSATKQLDSHGIALLAAKTAPAVVKGAQETPFEHFLDHVVSGVEGVVRGVHKVVDAASSAAPAIIRAGEKIAPYAEAIAAALGVV